MQKLDDLKRRIFGMKKEPEDEVNLTEEQKLIRKIKEKE